MEESTFLFCRISTDLLGAIWALEEGNMADDGLIIQVQQGKRRPKGILFHRRYVSYENLPQTCKLRSLRISHYSRFNKLAAKGRWANLMQSHGKMPMWIFFQ